MTGYDWVILVTIVLYMFMMVGIGIAVSGRNKTSDDFYLGGRKLALLKLSRSLNLCFIFVITNTC